MLNGAVEDTENLDSQDERLVWHGYKRNFKGQFPPEKPRKMCIRNGGNIAVYGAGFVSQDVLLHSGFSILVFVLAVVMMVVMLVIFDILVMKLFCCFYMQIKSSGYYFTQVIFF